MMGFFRALFFRQSAFVLLLVAGILFCTPVEIAAQEATVKIMSFDIGSAADESGGTWEERRERVFRTITGYDPDILTVQDALRYQLDHFHAEIPGYAEVGSGRINGVSFGEYAAVMVRESRFDILEQGTFWFSDTPDLPGTRSWGNEAPCICTWVALNDRINHTVFYVFNVFWDETSVYSRMENALLLSRRIAQRRLPGTEVILTGNFDAGEQATSIRFLKGEIPFPEEGKERFTFQEFRDSFRLIYPERKEAGTYHRYLGGLNGEKTDYILVSDGVMVKAAAILTARLEDGFPSDHFPVTADVIISQTDAP